MFRIDVVPISLPTGLVNIVDTAVGICLKAVVSAPKGCGSPQIFVKIGSIESGQFAHTVPTGTWRGSPIPKSCHLTIQYSVLATTSESLLGRVVLHELFHCLGFGCGWTWPELVQSGDDGPQYVGKWAVEEYRKLLAKAGRGSNTGGVPVEADGPEGKKALHWSDVVFRNELMTPNFLEEQAPLSAMSIAALRDLGYEVNPGTADAYALP